MQDAHVWLVRPGKRLRLRRPLLLLLLREKFELLRADAVGNIHSTGFLPVRRDPIHKFSPRLGNQRVTGSLPFFRQAPEVLLRRCPNQAGAVLLGPLLSPSAGELDVGCDATVGLPAFFVVLLDSAGRLDDEFTEFLLAYGLVGASAETGVNGLTVRYFAA